MIAFGFEETAQGYAYAAPILNGQFVLNMFVRDGVLTTSLIEKAFGDEYVLHLVPETQGEFVGKIKAEYRAVLQQFAEACCETDVFQSEQAHAVIEYVRQTYGDALQYLWEKFPENAVFRRQDTQTWYAALLVVSRKRLGFDSDELTEIIDFRMRPELAVETVDGEKYFPGYHMNKKTWVTVVLDGSVATEELCRRIDDSYILAGKKQTKK